MTDTDIYAQALAEIRALTPASVRYSGYIPTHQRTAAFAELATEMAGHGHTVQEIAVQLCVSEGTARQLIAGGDRP